MLFTTVEHPKSIYRRIEEMASKTAELYDECDEWQYTNRRKKEKAAKGRTGQDKGTPEYTGSMEA